jgi:hypothetical protein
LYLLRKTKTDDVTPAKAGVQSEKLDSRFRGNDKYCFRNRNYLVLFLLFLYGFGIPLSRNSRMVGGAVLSLASSSETGHKPYIIKRESVCHQ